MSPKGKGKDKDVNRGIDYPVKIFFKCESEINVFLDK